MALQIMQYECEIRGYPIPWDAIAHRLSPGYTGDAIKQKLARDRKELIAEGHLVPPKSGPRGNNKDPWIRGYVRAFPGTEHLLAVRPVRFDDVWHDPAVNDVTATALVHNRSFHQDNETIVEPPAQPLKINKRKMGDMFAPEEDAQYEADLSSMAFDTPNKMRRGLSERIRMQGPKNFKEMDPNDEPVAEGDEDFVPDAHEELQVYGVEQVVAYKAERSDSGEDADSGDEEADETVYQQDVSSVGGNEEDGSEYEESDDDTGDYADDEYSILVSGRGPRQLFKQRLTANIEHPRNRPQISRQPHALSLRNPHSNFDERSPRRQSHAAAHAHPHEPARKSVMADAFSPPSHRISSSPPTSHPSFPREPSRKPPSDADGNAYQTGAR